MNHKVHQEVDTTFLRRAGINARKHWMAVVISSVMGTLTGTVVPMLEQWHSDRVEAESKRVFYQRLNEVETRLAKLEQKTDDFNEVKNQPQQKP